MADAYFTKKEATKILIEYFQCSHISETFIKAVVEQIPAADVRPVVRGKWEPGETIFFCGEEHTAPRICSVCGRSALDEPWYFCPNCGADMRGEGGGEDGNP